MRAHRRCVAGPRLAGKRAQVVAARPSDFVPNQILPGVRIRADTDNSDRAEFKEAWLSRVRLTWYRYGFEPLSWLFVGVEA